MTTISNVADWLAVGLPLIILSRLIHSRMVFRYRFFFLMLIIEVGRDLLLRYIDWNDPRYDRIWLFSLLPWLVIQIAAVTAVYHDLAKLYTGAGRFAGWMCAFAVALGLSASLVVNFQVTAETLNFLPWTVIGLRVEQSFSLILLAAMCLILLFLSYFPWPLEQMSRNLKTHLIVFACYVSITAALDVSITLFVGTTPRQDQVQGIQTVAQVFYCLCYAAWAVLISKSGEKSARWPDLEPKFKQRLHRAHNRMHGIASKRILL